MRRAAPNRLIVVTRYPQPGRVKTRLIPSLGADGAAELHRQMTVHTLAVAADLRRQMPDLDVVVRFAGGTQALMTGLFGPEWLFEEQGDGDLGTRLDRATHHAFTEGSLRVIVIGSDCPELTSELLQSAFQKLGSADTVIGPASDGGYYLIGLTRIAPSLFVGMPWGTSEVFARTVWKAKQLALDVAVLPTLRDIDRPEDVTIWKQSARI